MAAARLSHFLAARRRNPVTVEHNLFAGLADAWPRAWACLGAVAQAYGAGGGRWPYRAPAAPVPELPVAEVEAPATDTRDDTVVLSGIDPRFDQQIVQRMRETAEPGDAIWLTASLSRISRRLGKLLQTVEYQLAHDVPVLTANYLLRPHDVWVRRGELAPIEHEDLLKAWRDLRGLSGVHRAVAAQAVQLNNCFDSILAVVPEYAGECRYVRRFPVGMSRGAAGLWEFCGAPRTTADSRGTAIPANLDLDGCGSATSARPAWTLRAAAARCTCPT